MVRLPRAVAVAVAAFLFAAPALAQDKEADAERLFREGQKLLEERRYGEACPKFEAAYAKDRQLGTLLNLAFCHKEQGSIWYAWLEFREAELKAGEMKRFERRDFARARLNELEKSLPKVTIDNPHKTPLTDVLVEEKRVPEAEHGSSFTAEEGKRKFTFKAKGKKSATVLVTIGKLSDKPQRVPVPVMEDGEDAPPVAAAPPPPPTVVEHTKVKVVEVEAPGSSQKTIGFVALGVAGTALIVGGVAGVMTLTNECGRLLHPTASGCTTDARDSASTTGLISTTGFIVAGVVGATGLILLLTAPKAQETAGVRPEIGLGWAGLRGSF
jgi:hypothetical protein